MNTNIHNTNIAIERSGAIVDMLIETRDKLSSNHLESLLCSIRSNLCDAEKFLAGLNGGGMDENKNKGDVGEILCEATTVARQLNKFIGMHCNTFSPDQVADNEFIVSGMFLKLSKELLDLILKAENLT